MSVCGEGRFWGLVTDAANRLFMKRVCVRACVRVCVCVCLSSFLFLFFYFYFFFFLPYSPCLRSSRPEYNDACFFFFSFSSSTLQSKVMLVREEAGSWLDVIMTFHEVVCFARSFFVFVSCLVSISLFQML